MTQYAIGQRWISEAEPELGLGLIQEVATRHVCIHFPAGDATRQYAVEGAPLKRIQFRVGDAVKAQTGISFTVDKVEVQEGLLTYVGEGQTLAETDLCHTLSFSTPSERLFNGHVDDFDTFDLRYETLQRQFEARKSRVRGFLGGRVELIPHQFYLAHEMALRQVPRVLLADEVGLGKTIEACLIMHRLLASGQIGRVLVLVPSPLIHQWFVELLRRFNLSFHIFDAEYCEDFQEGNPEDNPFSEYQLGLSTISFFRDYPEWRDAAMAVGWDMVVVDEAHHLAWLEQEVSVEYGIVEQFSKQTKGLLLLTATPEQLGPESHFARLRLLDPNRYPSYQSFLEENHGQYKAVAEVSEKILSKKALQKKDESFLNKLFVNDAEHISRHIAEMKSGNEESRKELVDRLLDQHGIGRVMFRNTRKQMTGFPKRKANLVPLSLSQDMKGFQERLRVEFEWDCNGYGVTDKKYDFKRDPRVEWLIQFLNKHKKEKVLLICRYKEKVLALDEALKDQQNIKIALFHEDLQLIRRDRNATWFAEEEGAQILLCSEIGSEGRNFQFAHHLVLFDLPLDQELLEQRIGRLDRIGQKETIHIHVPYFEGSPQEVMVRWYHEGLRALEHNAIAGCFFDERFDEPVKALALSDLRKEGELEALIDETKKYAKEISKQLEQGRDRLLELNSFRPEEAKVLLKEIQQRDESVGLDEFMERIFDHFGVQVEFLSPRTFLLTSDYLFTEAFPGLKQEGMQITYDRRRALSHEEVQFLSWDHPMVVGAMDLMLGSEKGNSCIALWPTDEEDPTLLMEAVFVLECVAPQHLFVDRFFPATPIRVVVNQRREDCSGEMSVQTLQGELLEAKLSPLMDQLRDLGEITEGMLAQCESIVGQEVTGLISACQDEMEKALNTQLQRLKDLKQINDHVQQEEIDSLIQERDQLGKVMSSARLRLDGLRLIWKGSLDL